MKVLYVGDHRESQNWGGRGQGIALQQLLESKFNISGVIPGLWATSDEAADSFVGTLLPQKYFRFLWRIRDKSKVADLYLRLVEEAIGARDFICDEPSESAESLIRYKSKSPGLGEIYEQVSKADVVVINGEGSGIFITPFRRDFFFYLAMIELSIKLNKKVFYVNGIIADCPFTGRNTKNFDSARKSLAKCHAVLVRDPESLDYLKREMPEVECDYIPDALFTWFPIFERYGACVPPNGDFVIPPPEKDEYLGRLDFSKPYICIGGSAWAANYQEQAVDHYLRLLEKVRQLGYPVYLTQNCGGDRFLQEVARVSGCGIVPWNTPIFMAGAILANCELFISGRFHATILASLGGTPCVFLGTHSHKMESLKKTLEYDVQTKFSGMPTDPEIDEILTLSKQYLKEGASRRRTIKGIVANRCEEAGQLPQRILDHLL